MMNRLMRLFVDNRLVKDAARRFEIVNAAGDEATVYLYDMIVSSAIEAEYWGGVAAEQFVRDFNAITAPTIHLRINSPGGDVFAARAMEQAIRAHASKVIAHVDGYAASAATYVALAADEVEISDGGFFMIHNSWSFAMGNAEDLRQTAGLLDQIDTSIVNTYVKRTNLDEATIRDMLAAETWIGAEDAVKDGWANRVAADAPKDRVNWNITALAAHGRKPKPKDAAPPAPPAAADGSRVLAERRLTHFERIAA
jgi:ATP-dependent Clp protease protease subunit